MKARVLAVDYGTQRIGLAISDTIGVTAQPLAVIDAAGALDVIATTVLREGVSRLVVGLPRSLSGQEGAAAEAARDFAAQLAQRCGIQVEMVDERFTTRIADQVLVGEPAGRKRSARDKLAATVLLQAYLERDGS